MYKLLKPILFRYSPEKAHSLTVSMWKFVLKIPIINNLFISYFRVRDPKLKRQLFGLEFDNPVGLAAGFDKDGRYYDSMSKLGFGFVEIGTVTPVGQNGNPQPRLFRLPPDGALINRMGFNNEGVAALVERLKSKGKINCIVGGNIGKNKLTPNAEATSDYSICFEKLYEYVDYFVVNVSSPNTPNLRELQDKKPLTDLLNTLQKQNREKPEQKPILLKIAPDLSNEQLLDIIEIVKVTGIAGLIATNTTIDRSRLSTEKSKVEEIGNGGLSGAPLKDRSTEVIRFLHEKSKGEIPIIGVGGIDSPEAAIEKLEAGASLIQVYSGMVYYGPSLVRDINKALLK